MRIFILFLILWMSLLVAACQANAVDAGMPFDFTPSPVVEFVPTTSGGSQMTPSLSADPGLQDLIDKAIADLAKRLSIAGGQITLLEATPVVWPDASLGCPQPGMAYAQVPEDGLLIRLQADNEIYEYHSGGVRQPFLCVKTAKDPNPPPQIDIFNLTPAAPKATPGTPITPDNSIPPGEDN